MAVDANLPEAPTSTEPPETLESPPQEPVDNTPAWQRAQTREEALQALLDDEDLPVDKLTTHKRVAGIIGSHANRQAQKLREQEANAAREARRRDLATNGRIADLGQEVAGDYRVDPQALARQQTEQALMTDAQAELGKFFDRLPKESQQKLSDRANDGVYGGTFGEGLRQWVDDLAVELVAAELPKALEKEIKRRDLIPRAVAEAERVNGLGSPDVRRGGAAGAVDYETEVEMATAFAAGEIDRQQMTTWYRRHRR